MADPHAPAFTFPSEYWFPPFFTMQDNATTRYHQLTRWRTLVLEYCRHYRIFRIFPAAAAAERSSAGTSGGGGGAATAAAAAHSSPVGPLFYNAAIDRGLSPEAIVEVLTFMRRKGSAERVGAASGGDGGGAGSVVAGLVGVGSGGGDAPSSAAAEGSKRDKEAHWIYWKTPGEWASAVETWVRDTAQEGTVLTLFELTQGDATEGQGECGARGARRRRARWLAVC
jgi:ESCRT-II complex subunit VPS25